MKPYRNRIVLLATVVVVCSVPARASQETPRGVTTNVTLWDTGVPLGDPINLTDRTAWKVVPPNLLMLEDDPQRALSSPAYYGREYTFQGDAVVENSYLTAVVSSVQRKVVVSSKNSKFEIWHSIAAGCRCVVLQNTGDDVALEVFFPIDRDKALGETDVLVFNKTPIVEIKPGETKAVLTPLFKRIGITPPTQVINLHCSMDYGIVPGFIGDDLVLSPSQYPSEKTVSLPTENAFLGLLKGENSVLVITWPRAERQMTRLGLGEQGQQGRFFDSISVDSRGQNVYVALLDAPGIWHREPLGVSYLEKDVASQWKRPFPAKWITQLWEGDVRTTYTFREAPPGTIWRAVGGWYNYPIWFDGDATWFHLGKKVLPKGESIIYFLDGQDTPASVWTPIDIMKATLGRPACDSILDVAGRKLRTHHRRGAAGIRQAATCGCTAAIEEVFKAGQEIEKKEDVEGAVGDMVYFVTRHVERLNEYWAFADDMIKFLRATESWLPELKAYVDGLLQIVQRIPEQHDVQKENIKSLEYADELSGKTLALLQKKDPQNLPACLDLGRKWRGMGGAQDALLGEYHLVVRKLFQEAGYSCLTEPKAMDVAREVRNRCRQCLRNPDGYEIWPNY
jgi:hypothetical protein